MEHQFVNVEYRKPKRRTGIIDYYFFDIRILIQSGILSYIHFFQFDSFFHLTSVFSKDFGFFIAFFTVGFVLLFLIFAKINRRNEPFGGFIRRFFVLLYLRLDDFGHYLGIISLFLRIFGALFLPGIVPESAFGDPEF